MMGPRILPTLIKPTTFLEKQKAKIPKFGKNKSMIDSSTAQSLTEMMANNVENKYGSDMFPGLNVCLPGNQGRAEVGATSVQTPGSQDFWMIQSIHMHSSSSWRTADTVHRWPEA